MVARAVREHFPHIAVRVSAPPGLGQQMAKIFVSQPGWRVRSSPYREADGRRPAAGIAGPDPLPTARDFKQQMKAAATSQAV